MKHFKKQVRKYLKDSQKFGYCHNQKHRGWVSMQTAKDHKCLEKKCPFLKLNKEHSYTKQKEKQNLENRVRKHLEKVNTTWTKQQCYDTAHKMSKKELEKYIEKNKLS